MTITNDRKKLIDKVTKLFALAEGTNHTAEAEAARNMGIELMAKHNLSYSDMTIKEEFTEKFEETQRKNAPAYETSLLGAIAKMNGVALIITGNANYRFIGRPSDLEAFEYMRTIVYQQRDASWQAYYKATYGKHPGAKYLNRFKNGFAIGVQRKINGLMNQMNCKVSEWGLVPVDPSRQALDWFKEKNHVRESTSSRSLRCSTAGVQAGQNINLNRGVTQQTGRLQIGA